MMKKNNSLWLDGWKSGEEAVFQFLKEMLSIDIKSFKKSYESWTNCDEYTNWKGKKVKLI